MDVDEESGAKSENLSDRDGDKLKEELTPKIKTTPIHSDCLGTTSNQDCEMEKEVAVKKIDSGCPQTSVTTQENKLKNVTDKKPETPAAVGTKSSLPALRKNGSEDFEEVDVPAKKVKRPQV